MTAVTSVYAPARRPRLSHLYEAAGIASMALVLALPLVGFQIADVPGGMLGLRFRLVELAVVVAVVFFGKLGLDLGTERPLPVLGAAAAAFVAIASVVPSSSPTIQFILGATALAVGGKACLRAVALDQAEPRLAMSGGLLAAVVAALGHGPLGVLWPLLAFAGLAVSATIAWRRFGPATKPAATAQAMAGRLQSYAGPVLVGLAVVLPFSPFADSYIIDVATLTLTYVMLGWGLNIVVGLAGLLDLGYVGFYAVGAYTFALLATHADLSFWVCLSLAGIMAALFGIVLGFPVLRLRGDYLAIVTLGFGEIIRIVLINWDDVTGGPNGIANIPRPTFFGLPFTANPPDGVTAFHTFYGLEFSPYHRMVFLYFLILALALATNAVTLRLRRLPVGRAWEALREDEIACRTLGINPTMVKLSAFALGALFAGFAGSFFASRQGFISPESFTFPESAVILAIVVLGGRGSQLGIVVAAFLLVAVPEIFRDLQEYRMLAFGLAMIGITIWRPHGLLAHREPTVRLPADRLQGRDAGARPGAMLSPHPARRSAQRSIPG